MRILFFSLVYPNPHQPTKGMFTRALVEALSVQHPVQVIAPVTWPVAWGLEHRTGSSVRPAPLLSGVSVHHPTYYYPPKVLRRFYGSFLWHSVRGTLERVLATFQPEAVIGYWAHPDGEVAVRAARRSKATAAIMVGGSDILLLTRGSARRRAITRVLSSADAIFAVGSDLKSRVVDLGIPAVKVHVFSMGVDTDLFCPGDRRQARERLGLAVEGTMLLWVGHIVPVKGLEVLLEACRLLREEGHSFRLALVGDGPLRGRLQAQAAATLGGSVHFAGAVAHHDLPDWYRAADLTVLSSHSEGVPNVLRESLACGTPFVATKVGSIAELTEHPGRDLVPPGDSRALAAVVARRLQMAGGAKLLTQVSWSQAADSIVGVLSRLSQNQ